MARKTILDLLDELAPDVQKAFLQAIENIRTDFQEHAFTEAFDRGDVEAALQAIGLGAEYFAPLDTVMQAAFLRGGEHLFDDLRAPARKAGIEAIGRFDLRNPRAERLVRRFSSDLIVEIHADQRESARIVLERNMREGVSAARTKQDLIGRRPARGMDRQGGIIGLTSRDAGHVQSVREILSDPERIREYFIKDRKTGKWKPRYGLTDRRFDPDIKRAIRDGKAIPSAKVNRVAHLYADRMLQERAESIARTELLGSLHAAQDEGLSQLVERGTITNEQITEIWDAANDSATRSSHRAMDRQKRKRGEPFRTGDGYLMRYPGDRSMGAPAKEIIRCRCRLEVSIDWLAGLNPGD